MVIATFRRGAEPGTALADAQVSRGGMGLAPQRGQPERRRRERQHEQRPGDRRQSGCEERSGEARRDHQPDQDGARRAGGARAIDPQPADRSEPRSTDHRADAFERVSVRRKGAII